MNIIDQLDWSYWKRLNEKDKRTLFSQVLMYFVNPLMRLTDIELKEFELYGIKCQTFELLIDEEPFVFIPGNQDAILGWNLGVKGLSLLETAPQKDAQNPQQLSDQANLLDTHALAEYINQHTSELRKVVIPPMLVQKFALPAGTNYLGIYDTITGGFHGAADQFATFEAEIKTALFPQLTPAESLSWSFPVTKLVKNRWYIEQVPTTDNYYVFSHEEQSYASLRNSVRKKNFDLLTEDQWEYVNGAGSRRLFRWGNELNVNDLYRGKKLKVMMHGENMFGLIFDTRMARFELTEDPGVVKLGPALESCGIPVVDKLPLSTYYRPNDLLAAEKVLDPAEYLYRKAIIVKI